MRTLLLLVAALGTVLPLKRPQVGFLDAAPGRVFTALRGRVDPLVPDDPIAQLLAAKDLLRTAKANSKKAASILGVGAPPPPDPPTLVPPGFDVDAAVAAGVNSAIAEAKNNVPLPPLPTAPPGLPPAGGITTTAGPTSTGLGGGPTTAPGAGGPTTTAGGTTAPGGATTTAGGTTAPGGAATTAAAGTTAAGTTTAAPTTAR